ncbi:hypothetical protein H6P81_012380 [Aristolochia fimbriata]|uniref:Uncharacterized protein n=1 Tax=Aristolochia fimbriata TaxID=158543 RepID=A0AAV7EEW5_ARIFI|nr:hypothetical protein H6P81_012380 [Aristolochia fimbriata]
MVIKEPTLVLGGDSRASRQVGVTLHSLGKAAKRQQKEKQKQCSIVRKKQNSKERFRATAASGGRKRAHEKERDCPASAMEKMPDSLSRDDDGGLA